jgi:hypothetical protein
MCLTNRVIVLLALEEWDHRLGQLRTHYNLCKDKLGHKVMHFIYMEIPGCLQQTSCVSLGIIFPQSALRVLALIYVRRDLCTAEPYSPPGEGSYILRDLCTAEPPPLLPTWRRLLHT